MNRKTRVYRFETLHHNRDSVLSLSSLNKMLTQAQKELPPRMAPRPEDVNDELASQLIRKVRRQFKSSYPAHWIGSSCIRLEPEETAGTDV